MYFLGRECARQARKFIARGGFERPAKFAGSVVKALPFMIRHNGLGQAAAFYRNKVGDHERLYNFLNGWLTNAGRPYAAQSDLLDAIARGSMDDYRLACAEALVLMEWVKTFAEAFIEEVEFPGASGGKPGDSRRIGDEEMSLPLFQTPYGPPVLGVDGHRGLWHDKFFNLYDSQWNLLKPDQRTKRNPVLEDWIKPICRGACGDKDLLAKTRQRIEKLGDSRHASRRVFATGWNFVSGLGLPHPLENGFYWHHTLGVPYLPGSSVKGLLRAWMKTWAEDVGRDRNKLLDVWFGGKSGEGELIFFDALPVEPVKLVADVMTPHMGDWYEKGGKIKNVDKDHDKVPADWHNPEPHFFLVVKDAKFLFQIAPRRGKDGEAAKQAMEHMKDALDYLGAGAKTGVGYGRMVSPEPSSGK